MNIFSGLEKFGLKSTESVNLFDDDHKGEGKKKKEKQQKKRLPQRKNFFWRKACAVRYVIRHLRPKWLKTEE